MKIDLQGIARFLIGLTATVSVIFGATIFACWMRTKIVFSPTGRFLARLGLSRANGAVEDFVKGECYSVVKNFTDYYGSDFKASERLTFRRHDYLPYHGGHTLLFDERTIYLQDETQAEILQKIYDYIEPIR